MHTALAPPWEFPKGFFKSRSVVWSWRDFRRPDAALPVATQQDQSMMMKNVDDNGKDIIWMMTGIHKKCIFGDGFQ